MFKNRFGLAIYYVLVLSVLILDPYKMHKSHILFWLFSLLIPGILIFLKSKGKDEAYVIRMAVFMISGVTMTAFLIIGAWHSFYAESFFDDLRDDFSKRPATLLEKTYEAEDQDAILDIFKTYYFNGHEVVVHSDEIIGDLESVCLSYPYYEASETGGKYVYVVDDGIQSGNELACFTVNGCTFYCSEDLYETGDYCEYDVEKPGKEAFYKLAKESYDVRIGGFIVSNQIIQIIAIIVLSLLGAVVTLPFWGKRFPFLSVVLSLPIGTVIWSAVGTLITSLGIRISFATMFIGIIVAVLPFIIIYRRDYSKTDFKGVAVWILPCFTAVVYFSYLGVIMTSSDSLYKCKYGLKLAIGEINNLQYTEMVSYGTIEPYIHALGYMLGGDFVYVIYPLFYVLAIAVLIYGIGLMLSKINTIDSKRALAAMSALGTFLLLINADYRYGAFYVLSHDIVTFYFLVIFVFLYLRSEAGMEHYGLILALASLAIIITRVEGIVYVLFILTVIAGYCGNDIGVRKTCIAVCALSLLWIIIQLLHFDGDSSSFFFTPSKAIILTCGTVVCATLFLCYDKVAIIKGFLQDERYPYIYVLALALCTLAFAVLYNPDIALKNTSVYISHLSSYLEYGNNSGYLWVYVILSLAALAVINNRIGRLAFNTVLGYLILVFLIFLFRKNIEIHVWWWDSGRRILVHMMPVAIWLIIASFYDSLKEENAQ